LLLKAGAADAAVASDRLAATAPVAQIVAIFHMGVLLLVSVDPDCK
jgi:hypothetical protein